MAGLPQFGAARKNGPGLNRISHPHWVKICVDPNGQINLRVKQKYEVLSSTSSLVKDQKQKEDKNVFLGLSCDPLQDHY